MVRYSSIGRRKGRTRRWVYIVLAIAIIAAIVLIYAPFGKDDEKEFAASTDTNTHSQVIEVSPEPVADLIGDAPQPTAEPNPQAAQLIEQAVTCLNDRPARIIEARDRLNKALPMAMSPPQRAFVKEQLSKLADRWLFSRTIFPQDRLCGSYRVKQGELLKNIGREHKVPHEVLLEINNISSPQALRAGETIKVINGPFHTRISRSGFTMDLYLQNTFVRSFSVGLGRQGNETPTGLWLVKPGGKLISPTWTDPDTGKRYEAEDPDYPLGSRWIGLNGVGGDAKGRSGFAIHGTKDSNEIGAATSRGCIRLHNGDAILIYNLLMPDLSQVKIVD